MADNDFMTLALAQAAIALQAGEVPVGAVVVQAGQVIALGSNAPIASHDPSAHAEMVALRAAAQVLGNYRLPDCELYVTLEPCAMCAGAMLHARLKRVVFGAADPRTGAAGSVLNLFANRDLNHQTELLGGVLADQCASLLQDFFRQKRELMRVTGSPLRDDALRTPDEAFAQLADYAWPAHYVIDLAALAGLRLHYLDEGPRDAARTYLCLHDHRSWSYLFRNQIASFVADGCRVVAPDMVGFGKSDKPKKEAFHTLAWHSQVLHELVERLDLKNVVLVVQAQNQALGLMLQESSRERCVELRLVHLLDDDELQCVAYQLPFPDPGHRAAVRAFAAWCPSSLLDTL